MEEDNKMFLQIIERLAKIETKIDDIKGIREDVDGLKEKNGVLENKIDTNTKDIEGLKANQKWVVVTIIGAVILAILKLILLQ